MFNRNQITEEVIELSGVIGDEVISTEEKTNDDNTKVIQAVIFYTGTSDNMINAGLFVDGKEVSPLQHINNYQSRTGDYLGNKPVHFESGKKVRFEVRTIGGFTADFKAQLILIKQKNC